jgi:GNAT superfamily N-acetyltransferase
MSIEIDILNGNASWPVVAPLMDAVWPQHVVEKLSWGHVKWAHADLRVLIDAPEESPKAGLACHVGIFFRTVTWDGRKVDIGGIGGVATRPDCRGHGYATLALNAAVQTTRRSNSPCCSASPTMKPTIRRAAGILSRVKSTPNNLRGGFASTRWRRSCSISPASRATASSTYAACRGDPCIGSGWPAPVPSHNMLSVIYTVPAEST